MRDPEQMSRRELIQELYTISDIKNKLLESIKRIKQFKGNMNCEKVYEIIDEALLEGEE